MAFSLAVFKGDLELLKCPYVDKGTAQDLSESIVSTDWREELVDSLAKEVSQIDFARIAKGIGAEVVNEGLKLRCLGGDYFISHHGDVTTERHLNIWIKILLLHYVRTAGSAEFSNKWISFSELRGGMVKATSFKRECEDPLKNIIDRDFALFEKIILSLGGKPAAEKDADHEWLIYPLPRIPFRILYWKSDNEFDSALKVLFDKSADDYLDVESYIFLGEGLVETLKRISTKSPSASQG